MGDFEHQVVEAKQSNWGLRSCVPIAIAALFCVICACNSQETNIRETNIDLTAYIDDMERLCTGVFEGTIQDGAGNNDDSVTYEPCEHDSVGYRLEIEMISEMSCNSSEDVEGVDCTHAQTGSIELAGHLEIGPSLELAVTASASIQQLHFMDGPSMNCYFVFDDDTVPYHYVETSSEMMSPSQDDLDLLTWSRRHTGENDDPTVWEICELVIENHE